ncbi:LysM peptidoglycan-binding domain-containing protein [Nitrosomonas sp. Nm166]|uniref:LysM peptidoglycan-binding domain-containing protein n=1 Tax=Nitrosomonas sp. Nm166 TaxID=1881054 RepID=UPI0008EFC62E|nr:LysM peptidoglycan-binding domain-containing protein [Nitrosomonas sp. Nm166]SFE08850.1 membrane-bound lytic murein transglycosylase D [Nitrosomonas sp. Nm166]
MIFNRNSLFALLISLLFWASLSVDVFALGLVQDKNQHHANLLDRVRSGFALILSSSSKAIRKIETPHTENPQTINHIIARSERYLFYIVEEVERRGMPMEIALIPVIESAYNPLIKSDNRSAGLWQFIPETAKILGLEQNVWHDDRRDIIASTEAALDYLQYLYQRFGDWEVAIAAYNLGEGAVSKVLSRNIHKGRSTSFRDLNLPVETKHYVYKLSAVKDIIANPKKYGIKLRPVPNRPYFDTVTIHEHIDISLVTRLANISEVEFTALNPAYNRYVIKVLDAPRTLLLPKNNKDIFLKNLETYQDPRISWKFYHVKKGENINEIAARYSTTVKQLQAINGISRNKNLTLGQKILVPQAVAENHAESAAQNKKHLQNHQASIHVVKKGDTLYEIAKRYGTTVDLIKLWNNNDDESLAIGQKLVLMKS